MGCAGSSPAPVAAPPDSDSEYPVTVTRNGSQPQVPAKSWLSPPPGVDNGELPPQAVGSYMKPGGKWFDDDAELRDFREKVSQDRGMLCYPFLDDPDQLFAAVCDGHGEDGEKIADFACPTLLDKVAALARGKAASADLGGVLKKAFLETNAAMLQGSSELSETAQEAGSTAVVVLLRAQLAWVGWVGDSRCVKGAKGKDGTWGAVELTQDHHPDHPGERKRLEKAGAYIMEASGSEPSRVYRGRKTAKGIELDEMNPGLGVANTRVLGDVAAVQSGVTAEPETAKVPIGADDTCLIIASDGIWEFLSSADAVAMCSKHTSASEAAAELVAAATQKWSEADEGCYRDDITCTVIFLPELFERLKAHAT